VIELVCAFLVFVAYVAGTVGMIWAWGGAHRGDNPGWDASAPFLAYVGYLAASRVARHLVGARATAASDSAGCSTSPARGTVVAVTLASLATWPAFVLWLPDYQYVPPVGPAIAFMLGGFPIWFAALLGWGMVWLVKRARWGAPGEGDWRLWRRAWNLLWAAHALSASTLTLRLAFVASWPAAEAIRLGAAAGPAELGPGWVGIYPVDVLGWVEVYPGTRVFVIQRLDAHGVRFPDGGAGFFHLDPGQPVPPYNEGTTGELVGGWWWYTTD